SVPLGNVMQSFAIGQVIESCHPDFKPGDLVRGDFSWQDYLVTDGKGFGGMQKVAPGTPPNLALSLFGVNGLTSYFGMIEIGSISKSDAATPQSGPANYSNLVARRARMEGFTGLDYPARVPDAFEALGRWQRDGSRVHKEDIAYGLENAPKALLRLFSGENFGKQLVKVTDVAA